MTEPTITDLYGQLGQMMAGWQQHLDQQMAWQAGPDSSSDTSPPNNDPAYRGYRVMVDAAGNQRITMTPAQLEKISRDAVKLITDLNPAQLTENFTALRADANSISTTLGSARDELTTLKDQASSARDVAKASELNSNTSAQNAAGSAVSAAANAVDASASAASATSSKNSAASSASTATDQAAAAAAASAVAKNWASALVGVQVEAGKYSALHHATGAANSAATSTTKASEAASSAAGAATSAATATTKAGEAASSAATATSKASEAAGSATTAVSSATTATAKATEASSSASKAQSWASGDVDALVEPGKYSALHHAAKAATSAASAQASASVSTTKSSEASNSASSAASSAATAATKASEAASSASTSTTKAAESAASAATAGTRASAAANSATAAANSATAAANSATAANSSATESAGSASMAEQYMLEAKNAMYVSTGALVEAGNISMAAGAYPAPLLDAKGNKLATFWKVTEAGVAPDSVDYEVGDTLVYSVATNGYYKIDNTESVTSVNGRKGAVVLTHADVGALAATATAVAATRLATARTVSLTGAATGSGSFDGTSNLSIAVTVADDGHKHTFSNLKGLPTSLAGYGITDAALLSHGHADLLSKSGGALTGAMSISIAAAPTIAGSNFAAGWLQIGSSTMGISIDPNEIYNVGTDLIIGTLSAGANVQFKPGGGAGEPSGEARIDGLYSMGSKVLTAAAGNAISASKLAAAVTVALSGAAVGTATAFDGSANIVIPVTGLDATKLVGNIPAANLSGLYSSISIGGNAGTATRLETPRTISLDGAVSGSFAFDGSNNVTATIAIVDGGHQHSFASLSGKPTTRAGYGITDAAPAGHGLGGSSYTSRGDINVLRGNGWQEYNGDGGDTNGATQYGNVLHIGQVGNATNYTGWASQIFMSSGGGMYFRMNAAAGSFVGSPWQRVYSTTFKPTAADVGAVAKIGDAMTGPLSITVSSASSRMIQAVNETDGWTWIQMGKSAAANQGHFAWNTVAVEGHPANAFHLRPAGGAAGTVLSVAPGVATVRGDSVLDFLANSTWGGKLRVGGNGRTAPNDGVTASVTSTNGNLHLDGASGDRAVYLSFYAGTAGVRFGNGAGATVGSVDSAGNMSMNGTITAPTFSGNATNANALDGIDSVGFARAYSASHSFGGNGNAIATADFITILTNLGAFNQPHWVAKGSWNYSLNQKITDTGCGTIDLAGAVIEVFGNASTYIIRVTTTTTTSGGGLTNAQFTYVNHGSSYAPGWRRDYNTARPPTAAEVGAMADGGTYGTATFNNWIRTSGATGWYNASYGGGMYMSDSTWVRTSHTKKLFVDNTEADAIYTAGGVKANKYMYVSGDWWRDNSTHSWNGNRYSGAPFSVDFNNAAAGSFLPMISSFSTQASVGYSARVKFGVLRESAGWAGIKAAIMVGSAENDGHPLATFGFDMYGRAGAVAFDASGVGSSQGLAFNGKTAIGGANDGWLRLNPHANFDTGIYCGSQILRTDGEFQVGGNGSSFRVTAAGAVSAAGQITAPQFNGALNGQATIATYLNGGASSVGITSAASRLNSGFYECSAPTVANGWPVSGSWYHLMASTHSNGGNYFSMQFSADFYNSNNLFFRCTNGNGATGWNQMWHSGNFDPDSKLSNNGSGTTLTLNSWFRSTGATGWYNETYQGGIYMEDATYVRVYNGKKFHVANATTDAISTAGGVTATGRVYAGTTVTGVTGVFDGSARVYSANNPPTIGTLSISNLQNSVSPYALLTLSGTGTPTATYASMLPTLLANYLAKNGVTGDVGDIAFMYCANSMPDLLYGATVAASYLYYGNSSSNDATNRPAGTWRCLGYGKTGYRTLFIRIA